MPERRNGTRFGHVTAAGALVRIHTFRSACRFCRTDPRITMPERILHLHVDPCTTHRTQIVYVSFLRARRFIHMLRHVRSMFDNCNRLRRAHVMTARTPVQFYAFFRTRRCLVHDPRIAVPQRVLHLHVDPCAAHRTQIIYVSFLRARRLVHMTDPVRRMFSQRDRFRRARHMTTRTLFMAAAFFRARRLFVRHP